jgi:hypothetical protein
MLHMTGASANLMRRLRHMYIIGRKQWQNNVMTIIHRLVLCIIYFCRTGTTRTYFKHLTVKVINTPHLE